ncbi:alpha/beta hydrolase [Streptococcus sp. CSL10205-OR2]|uniref:alpha/beta hydrolase n=1 Tax=Streptococcus sp. CSL10205-OR2 TaxID=2980558 RepID=UPI0021D94942|nr:alpha/beta hydrolase [Streptococcus sp. CSL10205-OR2]MCU9533129.1 alpha/beta hydrolase [Streptococcus sp. CSL10205-OR2]
MKKLTLSKIIIIVIGILSMISLAATFYFFNEAQVRAEKTFINNKPTPETDPLYAYEKEFAALEKTTLEMTNGGLKQVAWYVEAPKKTDKTVIIVHGFSSSKERMMAYGWLFHKLGYNVLMPDNIAAGDSEGRIIGYGWNDRLNIIKWSEMLIDIKPNSQIILFGLSMGGATVMMASGEEELPKQVIAIIEDAGYTSVWDELVYQAKDMYNLPAFPLLYQVSAMSKIRAGFTYGEASSIKQLEKNTRPILFIHGSEDKFVPTEMVYENYEATTAPKELYIVEGADHAKTFSTDVKAYEEKIASFLKKYDK